MTQLPLFRELGPSQLYPPPRTPTGRNTTTRLKSFSGNGWHTISLSAKTCDCDEFKMPEWRCKHLTAVGIHRLKPFIARACPTFSQALSALVKSIRLRRPEDATYWLMYLTSATFADKQSRFRVARRLLQATAEDGFSLPVMEKCAENFKKLCHLDTPLIHYVAEALRVCKAPNWWHPASNGPDYINTWLIGWRQAMYEVWNKKPQTALHNLKVAILAKDKISAAKWWCCLNDHVKGGKPGMTAQVQFVQLIADQVGHSEAQRVCAIHLSLKTPLAADSNFIGEAIWYLCGGECRVAYDIEPVTEEECQQVITVAAARWESPQPIPAWCCDGIHCAGNDTRFAGILTSSMATCNAFEHYGRVEPADEWLPEFQCYDGLVIE